MTRVATSRLIDASATLEAADRALVNLWVNRGLDDAAVARMTHMSEQAIAERRHRIVERLSDELGLPPDQVRAALTEITPADTPSNGAPPTAPAAEEPPQAEERPQAEEPPQAEERPQADERPETDEQAVTTGGRGRPLALVLIAVVAAAIVVVVLATRGGSSHRRTVSASGSASVTAATTPAAGQTPPPTSTTTPAASGAPGADLLTPLPGGPAGVSGSTSLVRRGKTLTLDLSVSNLPPPRGHGHYEAWLYNSLLIARPLGRLGTGAGQLRVRLPRGARRYRWIDISFQPAGDTYHSGESLLRAANPARRR